MDSSDDRIWPSVVKFAAIVLVATFWILLAIYVGTWFLWRWLA